MPDTSTRHHSIVKALRLCQKTVFPPVMNKVLQEATQPDPDLERIADIIRMDPPLTAMVLALANSAFYRLSTPVADIQRAAVVLGNKELVKLILFAAFQKNVASSIAHAGDLTLTWNAMIWAATAAEKCAAHLDSQNTAKAYLCALLKDLSRILLLSTDQYPLDPKELATFSPKQADLERQHWGTTHEVLTKELLDQWKLSNICTQGILAHHDMLHLDSHPPLVQAVILGTRWAEVELHHKGDPEPALHFFTLAQKVLGLTDEEFTELRLSVAEEFAAICGALNISQIPAKERFFQHSIASMQKLYFLSMDIRHAPAGLDSLVKTLAMHMKMHWGIGHWDMACQSPFGGQWLLYHDPCEGEKPAPIDSDNIPWHHQGLLVPIQDAGTTLAWLRLAKTYNDMAEDQELHLYFHFVGQHLASYLHNQAQLESKAHTLDAIPIAVARLDASGIVVQFNEHFAAIHPSPDSLKGRSLPGILTNAFGFPQDAELTAFLKDDAVSSYTHIFYPPASPGSTNDTCIYLSIHQRAGGTGAGYIALLEDISKVRSIEADIFKQQTFLHNLVASMQDLVLTVDQDGTISYVSPQGSSSWLGRNLFQIAQPEKASIPQWNIKQLEQTHSPIEVILKSESGQRAYELIISELPPPPLHYLVVGRDVSQIRRLEKKIKRQAVFDGLTKVFNRHQFNASLSREVKRSTRTGRPVGMIFFDVDSFKGFNDQHGHQAGDKVLKDIGSVLRKTTRQGMDIPCRYGGDEFVILATEINKQGLHKLASRIKESFDHHFSGKLSLSIGLALFAPKESPESFLHRADTANYAAKAQGGNCIVFAKGPCD